MGPGPWMGPDLWLSTGPGMRMGLTLGAGPGVEDEALDGDGHWAMAANGAGDRNGAKALAGDGYEA